MLKKFFVVVFVLCSSVVMADEPELSYAEAYTKAEKEKKPLVVLIGAKWCPSCVQMKSDTIDQMKKEGDFKEVVFTSVDVDNIDSKVLDGLLIVDQETKTVIKSYPQIVVFNKSDDNWKKLGLRGRQSRPRIIDLLKKAMSR